MKTEKIEEICGNCLHWPVCYKLLSQHEGNACSSRLEYGLFRPRKELDELAALKVDLLRRIEIEIRALIEELEEENEELREALEAIAGIRGATDENAWRVYAEMVRIARGALVE